MARLRERTPEPERGVPLPESRGRMRRMRLFTPIWEATEAGDEQLAVKLLREYMKLRREEAA